MFCFGGDYPTGMIAYGRRGEAGFADLWRLLLELETKTVPFDEPQAQMALKAFSRYGKGIHSKARLNLCDCVSYALAKTLKAPLLFQGNDFLATDITPAGSLC
jgi:ribonuclease VapC